MLGKAPSLRSWPIGRLSLRCGGGGGGRFSSLIDWLASVQNAEAAKKRMAKKEKEKEKKATHDAKRTKSRALQQSREANKNANLAR